MGFGGSSGGSSALSGATDVALNNVADDQQLQYDTATSKWRNGVVASRLIENINTVASSGTAVTIPDVTSSTVHLVALSANCTFTFPAATPGKSFTIRITFASSPYTVTWPSSVRWPNSTAPTLTQAAGKQDMFSFVCLASGLWMGFVAGQNYSAT